MLNKPGLTLAGILMLGLIVRCLGILSRPIWYDEAFSVLFSGKGFSAMVLGTLAPTGAGTADIHPLGYYLLLWGWMQFFGQSLIAVRSLSILAGMGVILLIHLLARDLFDQKTAVVAALITALAPFQIHFAQEIRAYVFVALWLLLATWAYVRGRTGHWAWWLVFAVSSALAQYSHNLAAVYLIPLAATPLINRDWKTARAVMLAAVLAVLLYMPWLVHLPGQLAKVTEAYWVEKPGMERVFTLLLLFVTNLPLPPAWLGPALFIALLTVSIAVRETIRAPHPARLALPPTQWTAYLTFTPPLLLFVISQWRPVYIERALLPSGAMFCLWIASALCSTKLPGLIKTTLSALLAIGSLMGISQHVGYRGFPYAPFKEVAAGLRADLKPGDVIVHSNKLSMLPAVYYDRELQQAYVGDARGGSTDTLALATQQVLGLLAERDLESAVGPARRVWFVIFEQSIREYEDAGAAVHPQLAWLMEHYPAHEVRESGDLRIYLFTAEP